MFSTLPTPAHSYSLTFTHAPQVSSPLSSSPLRSSPLSPHDANLPPFRESYDPEMSPTPTSEKQQSPTPPYARNETLSFSRRTTKINPLIHGRDDGRETRRNLFLKKVRESSDDKRWASRGGEEEMMRVIWVQEERKRIETREKEAMFAASQSLEEEEPEQSGSASSIIGEEMADEVAQAENAELEAILSEIDAEGLGDDKQEDDDTPYGSDDEEYENLFMDVIQRENNQASQFQQSVIEQGDYDMMDIS